jgi:hypothetical protein
MADFPPERSPKLLRAAPKSGAFWPSDEVQHHLASACSAAIATVRLTPNGHVGVSTTSHSIKSNHARPLYSHRSVFLVMTC